MHHVVNRGDQRELIFHDDQDRQRFRCTLGEACEKQESQLYACCLRHRSGLTHPNVLALPQVLACVRGRAAFGWGTGTPRALALTPAPKSGAAAAAVHDAGANSTPSL